MSNGGWATEAHKYPNIMSPSDACLGIWDSIINKLASAPEYMWGQTAAPYNHIGWMAAQGTTAVFLFGDTVELQDNLKTLESTLSNTACAPSFNDTNACTQLGQTMDQINQFSFGTSQVAIVGATLFAVIHHALLAMMPEGIERRFFVARVIATSLSSASLVINSASLNSLILQPLKNLRSNLAFSNISLNLTQQLDNTIPQAEQTVTLSYLLTALVSIGWLGSLMEPYFSNPVKMAGKSPA